MIKDNKSALANILNTMALEEIVALIHNYLYFFFPEVFCSKIFHILIP